MNYLLALIAFAIVFPGYVQASENRRNYNIGLSIKQLSLDVYERGMTDPEGILTSNLTVRPAFGIESKITYATDSNFGYKYVLNLGQFNMTTQEVRSNDVNLGTSANGYYLYAMPVGVFSILNKENSTILVGIGMGIGYLNATGHIIFTESTQQPRHYIDISKFTYSFGIFFEHEIYSWSYCISLYGPEIDQGNYEYNLFDFGITVRKMIYF